jgi:DNA-binding NtrC family response regulator
MVNDAIPAAVQAAQTLLVVDDERSLRFSIGEWARDQGFHALEASGGDDALAKVRERCVDVVLLDLRLGQEDGMDVLRQLRGEDPALPVIMLTGHGTMAHAVEATRLGAFHFVTKPPDLDELGVIVARALEHARLQREVEHWRSDPRGHVLVGESLALKDVLHRLERAARSDTATVLIRGETGVGKELMARQLHARSARATGPFIDLNCSAIPEQLLESELYGHERGAFTDAKRFRKGLFELAHHGTLFLDEIGEMAPQLQAKLLRVLESRTFRRVGGSEDVRVDVRVVAATHRDLRRLVEEGRFREDLYFRLNVVPIDIPPLRERRDDVPALAEHFMVRLCAELGRPVAQIEPEAMAALSAYAWPGNIRELKNALERMVLLEADDAIRLEHLPPEITGVRAPEPGGLGEALPSGQVRPLAEVERLAIEQALAVCGGNKTRAATQLGISRQTLRTKLKEYALGGDTDDGGEEDA